MDLRGRKRRRSGASFYMALGLCVAAVCLVALSTMINRQQKNAKGGEVLTEWASEETEEQSAENIYPEDVYPEDVYSETAANDGNEEDITPFRQIPEDAVPEKTVPDERESQVVAASAEAGEQPASSAIPEEHEAEPAAAVLAMPVPGQIIKSFSGAELVFCSTFGDWRVHEGMDIAADAGGEVRCAASGVVMDFVEDPLYGYSVAVNQDDDAIMYYCGLSSTCMVSPGMEVNAGDVIGYVGEVPCEASDGSHIHIALMKDGQFTDPQKYMP